MTGSQLLSKSSRLAHSRRAWLLNASTCRTIDISSQNILAAALPRSTTELSDIDTVTVAFSLIPISSTLKPTSWAVKLPPKTTVSSPPSFCPASIDYLLFSSDGAHLFVASRLACVSADQAALRLTVLQQEANVDEWKVVWDEVVFNGMAGCKNGEIVAKRVVKAAFLGQQRRVSLISTPSSRG